MDRALFTAACVAFVAQGTIALKAGPFQAALANAKQASDLGVSSDSRMAELEA